MRDLTDRALDTAAQLGADYADVARRPPPRRVDRDQVRPGRGRRRRRDARASASASSSTARWGFASSSRLTAAEADRVAGRGRPDREGIARPRSATASGSTTGRRPTAPTRRRSRRTRSSVPLEEKIGYLLAADDAASRGQGRRRSPRPATTPGARCEDLRRDRRQLDRADDHPRRRGHRGQRDRGRRAPAPELPRRRRRPVPGGRLRVRPRARPRRPRRGRSPRRPSPC